MPIPKAQARTYSCSSPLLDWTLSTLGRDNPIPAAVLYSSARARFSPNWSRAVFRALKCLKHIANERKSPATGGLKSEGHGIVGGRDWAACESRGMYSCSRARICSSPSFPRIWVRRPTASNTHFSIFLRSFRGPALVWCSNRRVAGISPGRAIAASVTRRQVSHASVLSCGEEDMVRKYPAWSAEWGRLLCWGCINSSPSISFRLMDRAPVRMSSLLSPVAVLLSFWSIRELTASNRAISSSSWLWLILGRLSHPGDIDLLGVSCAIGPLNGCKSVSAVRFEVVSFCSKSKIWSLASPAGKILCWICLRLAQTLSCARVTIVSPLNPPFFAFYSREENQKRNQAENMGQSPS